MTNVLIDLLVVCLLLSLFSSCRIKNPARDDQVESLQSISSFPVGVAVGEGPLSIDTGYRNVIINEFNSLTPENAGKIEQLHPAENVFDFAGLDSIVEFAKKNKKRVHGTTLIWHDFSDMAWVRDFKGDSVTWERMFKAHIQTVVKHYRGKVASWDVVNEPFHEDGSLRVEEGVKGDNPGSIWARHLGRDYIARAFQYAHEADPEARLFLNDFDLQYSKFQKKIDAVVNLANDFKERGIPIHGLGMQMHIGISASNEEIAAGMRQLASTGLLVHISEVSILVSDWKKDSALVFTDELNRKQSDKYRFLAEIYRQVVPSAQRYGITVWGTDDKHTWITGMFGLRDWPLLFDSLYRKKPAYNGFLEGLKIDKR